MMKYDTLTRMIGTTHHFHAGVMPYRMNSRGDEPFGSEQTAIGRRGK